MNELLTPHDTFNQPIEEERSPRRSNDKFKWILIERAMRIRRSKSQSSLIVKCENALVRASFHLRSEWLHGRLQQAPLKWDQKQTDAHFSFISAEKANNRGEINVRNIERNVKSSDTVAYLILALNASNLPRRIWLRACERAVAHAAALRGSSQPFSCIRSRNRRWNDMNRRRRRQPTHQFSSAFPELSSHFPLAYFISLFWRSIRAKFSKHSAALFHHLPKKYWRSIWCVPYENVFRLTL